MTSKSVKLVSLLLLAGLASGTVYARGGGGGTGGMGGEHAQREQTRTHERTQQRVRAKDGAHSAPVQHHQNRYAFGKEHRERGLSGADR